MTTADLLGKILQVVMGLVVFAAIVGLLIFFIDKAPKKGRDYWQLALFLLPALLFIVVGLVYPAIRTSLLAFQDRSGDWSLDNFIWMFTQPSAIRTLINTVVWVAIAPIISTVIGLAYAVFIDKSRGEKYYKVLVFMPIAISSPCGNSFRLLCRRRSTVALSTHPAAGNSAGCPGSHQRASGASIASAASYRPAA